MSNIGLDDESKSLQLRDQLEALSLSNEAKRIHLETQKHVLRSEVAQQIIKIFRWANIWTLILVAALAVIDSAFLAWGGDRIPENGRMITPEVVMALLAATVAQTGTAAAAIVLSLFPRTGERAED